MKIISFDVGMKNLAYCLFNINNKEEYSILKWDVINICDENEKCYCNYNIVNKDIQKNKLFKSFLTSKKHNEEILNYISNKLAN